MTRVPHYIVIGASQFSVLLPNNYFSNGGNIGIDCGFSSVADSSKTMIGDFLASHLVRNGILDRQKIRYQTPSGTKIATILVTLPNVSTVKGALLVPGKTYKTGAIKSVYRPRRAIDG
jgi:hypothetical protein